jgi:hypothetical protein
MTLEQRILLNLVMPLKEAAGRGRLDPRVGTTFPDRMKLPALPGFVFSFAFDRHNRIAVSLPDFSF